MDTSLMTREEINNRLQELEQNITSLQLERNNNGSLTPEVADGLRQAYQELESFRNATQQTITNDNRIKELEQMIQEKQNNINSLDQAISFVSMGSDSEPESIKDEVEKRDSEANLQNEYKEELNKLLSDLQNLTYDNLSKVKDVNSKRMNELANKDRSPEEEAEYKELNKQAMKIETEFLRRYANNYIYKNQEVNGLEEQKRNGRVSLSLLAQRNTDPKSEEYELEKAYANELVRNLNLIECEIERQRPFEISAMTGEQLEAELDRLLDLMEAQSEKYPYDSSRPFVRGRNNELYNLYVEKTNALNEELTNRKNNVNTQDLNTGTQDQDTPAQTQDDPDLSQDNPAQKQDNPAQGQGNPAQGQGNPEPPSTPESNPELPKEGEMNFDVPHLNNTISLAKTEGAKECVKFRHDRNKGIGVGTFALMTSISLLGGTAVIPAIGAGLALSGGSLAWATLVDVTRKWNFNRKMIEFANKCDCDIVYDYEEGNMNIIKFDDDGNIEKTISNFSDMKPYLFDKLCDAGLSDEVAQKETDLQFDIFAKDFRRMSKVSRYDQGKDINALDLSKDLSSIYDARFGGITNAGNLLQQAGGSIGRTGGKVIARTSSVTKSLVSAIKNSKASEMIQLGTSMIVNRRSKLNTILDTYGDDLSDEQKNTINDAKDIEDGLIDEEPSKIKKNSNDFFNKINEVAASVVAKSKRKVNADVQTQNSVETKPEPISEEKTEPVVEPQSIVDTTIIDDKDVTELSSEAANFNASLMEEDLTNDPNQMTDTYNVEPVEPLKQDIDVEQLRDDIDKQIQLNQINGNDLEVEALRQQLEELSRRAGLDEDAKGMGR